MSIEKELSGLPKEIKSDSTGRNQELLPGKELLSRWSFETSLGKSSNKLSVTEDIISLVEADAHTYETVLQGDSEIQRYEYRIKTPDSIRRNVLRYPNLRFQSVFNDILGIRIPVNSYNIDIPEYFRTVDMTEGKSNDDGYRAVHLYYKESNLHYVIEVQLWSEADYNFNLWSHIFGYKYVDAKILRQLRDLYDIGQISSYNDYRKKAVEICLR